MFYTFNTTLNKDAVLSNMLTTDIMRQLWRA
jgi:hypothetical protein